MPPQIPPADRPEPDAESHADSAGADLLAYVRGELDAAEAGALEARLAASAELRAERDRLATDHAAWQAAASAAAPMPRPATLGRILAAIRPEAAERRQGAAATRSALDDVRGGELVAFAFDELSPDEARAVDAAVADDAALRDEIRVARRLRDLTRHALMLSPRAETWAALRERIGHETPERTPFDTGDIPEPKSAPRRGGALLRMLPPLIAVAAAIVLAVVLTIPPTEATVVAGVGRLAPSLVGSVPHTPHWVGAEEPAFHFDDGDVIEALTEPLTVRVACRSDAGTPRASGPARPGTAEFVLEPGARLARSDAAHFDLLAGQIRVTAHDLRDHLEIRAGDLYVAVRGTEFTVSVVEGRLVTVVHDGTVELGRRGTDPAAARLTAGEQGLVDADRLLRRGDDGRDGGAAFLTPRASLTAPGERVARGAALLLDAMLEPGEGGSVTIAAFDASVPLFLVRLKGPGGRELEVKIQDSMLAAPAPVGEDDDGSWRLSPDAPYRLALRIEDLDLEPGRWEARLRYMSYRTRSQGAEWLGVVQSAPVTIEVTPR